MKSEPKLLPSNLTLLELTVEDLEVLLDDEHGIISTVIDARRPVDLADVLKSSCPVPNRDSAASPPCSPPDKQPDECAPMQGNEHRPHPLTESAFPRKDESSTNPKGAIPSGMGNEQNSLHQDENSTNAGDVSLTGVVGNLIPRDSHETTSLDEHSCTSQSGEHNSNATEYSSDGEIVPPNKKEDPTPSDGFTDSTHNLTAEQPLPPMAHSTSPSVNTANHTYSIYTDHDLCLYFVETTGRRPGHSTTDARFYFLDTSDLADWQGILRYLHWEQHGLNSLGDE